MVDRISSLLHSDDASMGRFICSSCSNKSVVGDESVALAYCYSCKFFLCGKCKAKHDWGHPSLQLSEHAKACPVHKKEVISFYCRDHKDVLCRECKSQHHQ